MRKAYLKEKKQRQYNLDNNIADDESNYFYLNLFSERRDLKYILTKKLGTFVQLTIVQSVDNPEDILIIANTHLYFHPLCEYVRLLQVKSIYERVLELKNKIEKYSAEELWNRDCSEIYDDMMSKNSFEAEEEDEDNDNLDLNEEDNTEDIFGVDEDFNEFKFHRDRMVESMLNKDKKFSSHFDQNFLKFRNSSAKKSTQTKDPVKVRVLVMGDMNFYTNSIGYNFLANSQISSAELFKAWYKLSHYSWKIKVEQVYKKLDAINSACNHAYLEAIDTPDFDIGPIPLAQFNSFFCKVNNLNLVSGSDVYEFTNYVPGFKAPIDHLFYSSSSLKLVHHAPMPSTEELDKEGALPSSVFPSDHISISMDFSFI